MKTPGSQLRTLISELPPESPEERTLRLQGQQRLKERLSQIPWYAEQGRKHGEAFWRTLHGSCVLS